MFSLYIARFIPHISRDDVVKPPDNRQFCDPLFSGVESPKFWTSISKFVLLPNTRKVCLISMRYLRRRCSKQITLPLVSMHTHARAAIKLSRRLDDLACDLPCAASR